MGLALESSFIGMTTEPMTLERFLDAQRRLFREPPQTLAHEEAEFLAGESRPAERNASRLAPGVPLYGMHKNALAAARAGACAAREGKFWRVRDWQFASQARLGNQEEVKRFGESIGLAQPWQCIADTKYRAVADDLKLAEELGIRSTPMFLLGRIEVTRFESSKRFRVHSQSPSSQD